MAREAPQVPLWARRGLFFVNQPTEGLKPGEKCDAVSGLAAGVYGMICDVTPFKKLAYDDSKKHTVSSLLSGRCFLLVLLLSRLTSGRRGAVHSGPTRQKQFKPPQMRSKYLLR